MHGGITVIYRLGLAYFWGGQNSRTVLRAARSKMCQICRGRRPIIVVLNSIYAASQLQLNSDWSPKSRPNLALTCSVILERGISEMYDYHSQLKLNIWYTFGRDVIVSRSRDQFLMVSVLVLVSKLLVSVSVSVSKVLVLVSMFLVSVSRSIEIRCVKGTSAYRSVLSGLWTESDYLSALWYYHLDTWIKWNLLEETMWLLKVRVQSSGTSVSTLITITSLRLLQYCTRIVIEY